MDKLEELQDYLRKELDKFTTARQKTILDNYVAEIVRMPVPIKEYNAVIQVFLEQKKESE